MDLNLTLGNYLLFQAHDTSSRLHASVSKEILSQKCKKMNPTRQWERNEDVGICPRCKKPIGKLLQTTIDSGLNIRQDAEKIKKALIHVAQT